MYGNLLGLCLFILLCSSYRRVNSSSNFAVHSVECNNDTQVMSASTNIIKMYSGVRRTINGVV